MEIQGSDQKVLARSRSIQLSWWAGLISIMGVMVSVSANAAISYVQSKSAVPSGSATTVTAVYSSAQVVGDLNVVIIGWGTATATVQSVTDTKDNVYTRVVGPTAVSGVGSQSIYSAKNSVAATAGSNTVTVTFNVATASRDLRIAEYSGIDIVNPVDAFVGSSGNSNTSSSGAMTTTNANDLIVSGNYTESTSTTAGTGYTSRIITSFGSILEDRIVTTVGSNTATAKLNVAGRWIMQAVAFKAAAGGGDTQAPTQPTNLTTAVISATQINLTWTASTDNVGVMGYKIERCSGASCTTFAQIATPTTTTYSDTGLTASTTYRYQVRAVDAAANLSIYSSIANATTSAAPDTTTPSAPTGLTATAASATQINLSWAASTDNVSVTGYKVERCAGTSCTTFAQISSPTTTSYSDAGLTASTTYRYQVRATDAAGNLSGYSSIASATTQALPDTTAPTAPTNLVATATSSTQINLTWTASTDNVAVTGYRVERCSGTSCTTFTQIATPTTASYSNTGLTASTTYRYQVRATDVAGNFSAYSTVVSATTQAAPDTQAPTQPTGLTATATSLTQINLSWTASTDNVGVTGYRVERCSGASCTTFAQIATPTTTSYSDTGLTASTTYRYQVRATDAAGNLSSYSIIVSATTVLYGGSITFNYLYDNLGRITQVTGSDGSVITYTYDANGNITTLNRQ